MADLLQQLTDRVWVINAGTNTGIIQTSGQNCLVIDPGQDQDSAKLVLKSLKRLGLNIRGVLITHAHADHFGACAYLNNRETVNFFASGFEAALIEQPLLEPIFLFRGAEPITELTHKFIMAKPVAVSAILSPGEWSFDGVSFKIIGLPGHSTGQVGLEYGDILFAGDAIINSKFIDKYKYPFYSDLEKTFQTLNLLLNSGYHLIVPGHGPLLTTQDYQAEVKFNQAYLESLLNMVREMLKLEALTSETLQAKLATKLNSPLVTPVQYSLNHTLILAILKYLRNINQADWVFKDNLWYWKIT